MYKRRGGQVSMLESPEMFGGLPLDPKNEWIRLSRMIPWQAFEERYANNFRSATGQPACPARMALGALILKERNRFSDEDVVKHLAMNPYFQYFIGLREYRYEAPFDASMMTRFRQRISPEMLKWVNDQIIEGVSDTDKHDDSDKGEQDGSGTDAAHGSAPEASGRHNGEGFSEINASGASGNVETTNAPQPVNAGTLILDATCAPQDIRFPTDASLLNEGRENLEEIIDILHGAGMFDGKKPRTYRERARKEYNGFSKSRKKSHKMIRGIIRKMLGYIRRDLGYIYSARDAHPNCLEETLPPGKLERLAAVMLLYNQQKTMYDTRTHRIPDRIVSLGQYWVRPIVRGKQRADVEFGAKVAMSVVDGFLRVEDMRWDAFNEGTTLKESVERYRNRNGHYPERILADTIYRTRENLQYCKERGIRMSGPRLGRRPKDEAAYRAERRQEWKESGERGEIERNFGVGKRRYSLGRLTTKLKHTSEVAVHVCVLTMNLWRKLRFLLCRFFYALLSCVDSWQHWGLKVCSAE